MEIVQFIYQKRQGKRTEKECECEAANDTERLKVAVKTKSDNEKLK